MDNRIISVSLHLMLALIAAVSIVSCKSKERERQKPIDGSCPIQGIVENNGDCGYLNLPVNYSVEDSKTLAIFWYKVNATSENEKRGTITLLVGGPGNAMSRWFLDLVNSPEWQTLRRYYDIVSFDYRGVGLSDPLLLEGISYCDDEAVFEEEHIESAKLIVEKCKAILDKRGYAVGSVSTANIVQDLDRILQYLDIDSTVLYGFSYGTRVALTAMRDTPFRVKGAILDGVFPIEVNGFSESGHGIEHNLRYFFESYQKEKYLVPTEYGDIEQRMLNMAQISVEDELAPYVRLILLIIATNAYHELRYLIADLFLDAFENRNIEYLEELFTYFAWQVYNNILEYEFPYRENDTAQLFFRPTSALQALMIVLAEEYAFLREEDLDINAFNLPETVFQHIKGYIGGSPIAAEDAAEFQKILQVAPAPSLEAKAVKSTIPTLLFSGTRDLQTPPHWGSMAEKNLKNSYHIIHRKAEHVYTIASPCALDIIDEFAESPNRIHNLERRICMREATKELAPVFDQALLRDLLQNLEEKAEF